MSDNKHNLFYLKETKDIIVLDETIKWWDKFHITRFADYVRRKFKYKLTKINMN
jgi:hypothetical protein